MNPLGKSNARGDIVLPDGRQLDFGIRLSARSKSVRLKLSASDGVVVIAPEGMSTTRVIKLVADKATWIAARLARFDAVRHLVTAVLSTRPEAFDLPALGESWRVEYRATRSKSI